MSNAQITRTGSSTYIGVDIGGTNTRIGLFGSLDAPDFMLIAKFPTYQSYEEQLHHVIAAIRASYRDQLASVGVSVAARIAKDGRSVIVAPNLLDYVNKPFAEDLFERLKSPVRLAHDTVCGLLAEKKFGILHQIDRSAYLTVSTGTGAAIQLGKASVTLISSIEIGHQILDGNSLKCLCGQVGCLETFTGGRQIELRYGCPIAQITDKAFWETFSDRLSIGLVNLAQLTRIDVVALSGAIVLNSQFLLPMLQEKVNTILKGSTLELKKAVLGENAPMVGAVVLLGMSEDHILH
ncbi:MAG TPA: ROK family protein [Methylomirabilota bacterium]|nr:ROK family protein [Methylomirabilota bacterium]